MDVYPLHVPTSNVRGTQSVRGLVDAQAASRRPRGVEGSHHQDGSGQFRDRRRYVLRPVVHVDVCGSLDDEELGTVRRECLDWLIPMSEAHLRAILKDWRAYCNGSRPHMALGPGVPDPPPKTAVFKARRSRHRLREGFVVRAKPVLGGLHQECSLVPVAG